MRSMGPAPVYVPHGDAVIDNEEVQNILPHRFPFLMVDRIVGFEGETKCTGIKCVTINEPFFQGHFPGHPIMPGVLQLEAMAQVASVLLLSPISAMAVMALSVAPPRCAMKMRTRPRSSAASVSAPTAQSGRDR